MSRFFAYDNPIWTVMGKVADVLILSFLWLIFSLPIVTLGASTSALYYVTLKLVENREGYLFKSFLKGFKESFVQSTIVWAIMGFVGGIIATSIVRYQKIGTEVALTLLWALIIFAFIYLLMFSVIFALNARLSTKLVNLFALSFMVCVKHVSWVMLMAVITVCAVAVSLFVFWPVLFAAPGAIAFVNSLILIKFIFPKYGWNLEDEDAPVGEVEQTDEVMPEDSDTKVAVSESEIRSESESKSDS